MSHDTEKWYKIWRKTDLWFGKRHKEFGKFSPEHSKFSKICTLIGSFCAKYITFDLKKYRGVIFHDTEEWCKIWRKTDLWFGKWHEEFGKFSPEHLKVSKLGLWWDPFVQSRKCMSLKFTEELCVMTIKNDTKTEKESTCHFTIDMRNLINFYPIARKSNICTLNWLLLTNVYNVWAKNVQKSTEVLCLMALKIDANFEGILTCAFKNDMRFLANLHRLK